jgi:NAD(P)-dependent dehydrogenase (short-subunit alcohol dehydrogenase family)
VPDDFEGKVAVVLGGATGMGGATVRRLAEGGATVVAGDISPHLEEIAQSLREKGLSVRGQHVDVASEAEQVALFASLRELEGGLDVLVNCAGIQTYGTAVETTEHLWQRTIAVNLTGMFLAAKFAIPLLQERGGGAIVNVASVQGLAAQQRVVAYAASKGGILAMTKAMAVDHAREGIRVNAVLPGSIDTPMLRGAADLFRGERQAEEVIAEWGASHPIGRVGRPEEVAELIAFLASDRAGFITGAEYRIDGGLMAGLPVVIPE